MKRVFQHPPEPLTGKKYWRSLGEYSNSPEFREWLEREFPAGASEISEDEWSRRDFMKLMGASMALAGLGLTSCRRPEMHLVPFTKSAEWTIPGKFLYYATAMPRRTGAIPLIATTVDGRPIKVEGNPLHPDRADVVLALDSDFLDCGDGDLASARAFTQRRRVKSSKDTMNRLYVVENRFTITGAMADHRLRCAASQIPLFTHVLASKIATLTKDSALLSLLATLATPAETLPFDENWLIQLANDLVSKSGVSIVLAGQQQSVVVQLLAYAMNSALKNIGRTVVVREFPRNRNTKNILQLADRMHRGEIKALFIFGGDPVYNAPRAVGQDPDKKTPLDWADLQKKVPEVVRIGYHEDATSTISQWHVPLAHYLESWGDALTSDGAYLSIQPMILPLFGGLSEIEIMNGLLGRPKVEGPELVQETFRATKPPGDLPTAWSKFLRDGFAAHVPLRDRPVTFNDGAAAQLTHQLWTTTPAPTSESPEIVFVRSYAMDDGRYANNGWLQELPDPITKLTWDNAAIMSPNFAKSLNVETGDLIQISINDTAKDTNDQPIRRELVIAAYVSPGHAENSVTISIGYGRKKTGPIADESGFNTYLLRTASNLHFAVADGKNIESVRVTKVGKKYPLANTQEHWSIEGRGVVREATLDEYREDNEFVKKCGGMDEPQSYLPSLYSHPPMDAPQQWGMTVDLNVCTGCSACVIACQAENNVPIVGKLQVAHGRAMHWLRIARYYASAKPFDEDNGEFPQNPEMVHQPMMCQHCENAPCETVCPVNATIHSEDGLNVMAYNRCVGTRYCANNCPFKVRRFNFFDYNHRPIGKKKIAGECGLYREYVAPCTDKGAPDITKMQKNPNVTVRMRGVMEKCTFCVQRIEEAKIAAHVRAGTSNNNLRIPRDSFTSACAQACPHEAITFGDIKDPESKVSKMKQQDRNYRLLEYLNVNTRTSYLGRIRNPNPKMPDADNIGVASPEEKA